MEGPTQRTGRRIKRQVAGHEINLEIVGVQDKIIKIKQDKMFRRMSFCIDGSLQERKNRKFIKIKS